ncbi:MAG TPA: hypothetical protein VFZ66_03600 [Herpetosiphonaceae bacterium]
MAFARSPRAKTTQLSKQQLLAESEATWRKWRAFLREKQAEHQHRQAERAGLDDLTQAAGTSMEVVRARLTAAERQELSAILEYRRRVAQGRAEAQARQQGQPIPDSEEVLGQLLQQIAAELDGNVAKSGMALLPESAQHPDRMNEFNHRAVASRTSDDDYLLLGSDSSRHQRYRLFTIGGVLLVIVSIGLLILRPFAVDGAAAPAAAPVAQVGRQSAPLWQVRTVTVGDVERPISGAALGYPLLICLSEQQQAVATAGTEIQVAGPESRRAYRLHADLTATPRDLVVANCAVSPPKLLRAAALVATETSQPLDPALISKVAVWGPDTDPATIPAERMRVDLRVRDAEIGRTTLILADGTTWSPTATTPISDGVELRYLVPLASGTQEAGWDVALDDGLSGRLALNLPAPVRRAELLRERVTVQPGAARVVSREGRQRLEVALTLTLADGASDLTLLPGDLAVSREGGAVIATIEWSPPTLSAGQPATVTIGISLDRARGPLELALAGYRARIGWE